jgi:hypothetical protein
MSEERSSIHAAALRYLTAIGKAKGFLTYDEVNDHMPASITSPDDIEAWVEALAREGIEIVPTSDGGSEWASPRWHIGF